MSETISATSEPANAADIRVVRGAPTDDEVAGLVVALALTAVAAPVSARIKVNRWVASARPGYRHHDGRPARPGALAWRACALPR